MSMGLVARYHNEEGLKTPALGIEPMGIEPQRKKDILSNFFCQ